MFDPQHVAIALLTAMVVLLGYVGHVLYDRIKQIEQDIDVIREASLTVQGHRELLRRLESLETVTGGIRERQAALERGMADMNETVHRIDGKLDLLSLRRTRIGDRPPEDPY